MGRSPALYIRLRSTSGDWIAPPELRDLLVNRARDAGTTLTDVVVEILADRYRVDVDPSGRKTEPFIDRDYVTVRLPSRLDTALTIAGARATPKRNRQREAMVALCEFFGLAIPPPPRRGPIPRTV